MRYPKLSVCCVTERRPEFMPFLAFIWNRAIWPGEKELIVATTKGNDESVVLLRELIPERELVVDMDLDRTTHHHKLTVGELRNQAKSHATGEWVTWADDDDWFSPRRFIDTYEILEVQTWKDKIQILALAADVPLLNLYNMRAKPRLRSSWWGGSWVRRELVQSVKFMALMVGEDGLWFEKCWREAERREGKHACLKVATQGDMMLCLSHRKNVSVGGESEELQHWPLEVPAWLDEESRQAISDLRWRLGIGGEAGVEAESIK
jgi:hypothetical protein